MIRKQAGAFRRKLDNVLVVDTGGKGDYTTLQDAHDALALAAGWVWRDLIDSADLTFDSAPAEGDWFRVGASEYEITAAVSAGDRVVVALASCDTAANAAAALASAVNDALEVTATADGATIALSVEAFRLDAEGCSAASVANRVSSATPSPYLHKLDTSTPAGTIYYAADTTENVSLLAAVDVIGVGNRVLTGNLSATGYATVRGIFATGTQTGVETFSRVIKVPNDEAGGAEDALEGMTAIAKMNELGVLQFFRPGVGPYVNLSERGGGWLGDHPIKPYEPFSANAVFCLIWDDARELLGEGASAAVQTALGDLTPLEYMVSKLVPCAWPIIADKIGTAGMLPTATLLAAIKAVGGDIGCHQMTHSATHFRTPAHTGGDAYTEAYHIANWETKAAKDAIEAAFDYPCLASYHNGYYDPGVNLTQLSGLMTRQNFIAHRISGEGDPISALPMRHRYPFQCSDKLALVAADAAYITQLVKTIAYSKGLFVNYYCHYVVADDVVDGEAMQVTAFKAMIDQLAIEMAAGRIVFKAPWMQPSLIPTYQTSRIPNWSFEAHNAGAFDLYSLTASSRAQRAWIRAIKGTGSTITSESVTDHNGGTSQACQLVKTTNDCILNYVKIPVYEGEDLKLTWYQKKTAGAAGVDVWTVWSDSVNGPSATKTNAGAGWELMELAMKVPLGVTSVTINFGGGTNSTNLIDDVVL